MGLSVGMQVVRGLGSLMLGLAMGGCAQQSEEPRFFIQAANETEDAFGSYVAGRFAHGVGDPRAADFLLSAAHQDSDNRVILQRAFMALLAAGRIGEAADVAKQLQAREAGNSIASLVLTLRAFSEERYEAARGHLGGLSGGGFQSLISPVVSAWIHAGEGDKSAALEALEPLGKRRGLEPFKAANRAFIHHYMNDPEQAEEAYQTALESSQLSSLQPVVAYAGFLQQEGRTADALTLIRDFMNRFRDNGFLERAHDRLTKGKPIESFAATPKGAVSLILFRAAGELDRDEMREPALVYAQLATHLAPEMDEAHMRLASLLREAERYEAALDALAKIDRESPLYTTAKLQGAWVYEEAGDLEAAVGRVREFLRHAPENTETWTTLGDIYRSNERFSEAAEAYTRAIALSTDGEDAGEDSADWFLYFTRGIAYERMGEWEKAEADLTQALALNGDDPQLLNYLGYSWIDRGKNLERGTELIQRAVDMRPRDGFIVDSLGWAYYLRGDYEKAVELLERAVLLEPSDPTINDHLGDAYWKVGRRAEARFQWRHALASDPDAEERETIARKLDYGLELASVAASDGQR